MQFFADLSFRALVGVHLSAHGHFSLGKSNGPVKFCARWYYVRSGEGVSARRIRCAMIRFYTKQTKIVGPKSLLIFSKSSDETFRCSEEI